MSRKVKTTQGNIGRDNLFSLGCVLMMLTCLGFYCTGLAFALRDTTGQYITSGLSVAGFTGSIILLVLGLRNNK
jgi:hypothetical protein